MVQTAIGGVTGLFGGGAATGLGKIASPLAARVATPVAQRVVTPALSKAGQAAISAGTGGATANVLDYGINGTNQTPQGYAGAATTGFVTSAAFSVGSHAVSSSALSKLEITPHIPEGLRAHVQAPNVTWGNRVVSTTIDSFAGGFRAAANEYIRPGGNVNDIPSQFVTGMLSGAEGPVAPTPAHRAVPAG